MPFTDPETGCPYEGRFSWQDYVFGALWCIVGVFGMMYAHVRGQFRRMGGY